MNNNVLDGSNKHMEIANLESFLSRHGQCNLPSPESLDDIICIINRRFSRARRKMGQKCKLHYHYNQLLVESNRNYLYYKASIAHQKL